MAPIHSTELLLGIKDPHLILAGDLQEERYDHVHQFRPSAQSASLDFRKTHRKVLTVSGHLNRLPKAYPHCGCLNQGSQSQDMCRNGSLKTAVLLGQYNFQAVYLNLKKELFM